MTVDPSPTFLTPPRQVTDLGQGSIPLGFYYYSMTMFWKTKLLIQLTFGVWNEELLEHMDVAQRAKKVGRAKLVE